MVTRALDELDMSLTETLNYQLNKKKLQQQQHEFTNRNRTNQQSGEVTVTLTLTLIPLPKRQRTTRENDGVIDSNNRVDTFRDWDSVRIRERKRKKRGKGLLVEEREAMNLR